MSDPIPLELSKLDSWFGCRPGLTRAEVLTALRTAGAKISEDGTDLTGTVGEAELEVYFRGDADRVWSLVFFGESVSWAGKTLGNLPLDDALRVVAPGSPAFWTIGDTLADEPPVPPSAESAAPNDEELLREGTVWIPARGLGLVVWNGDIMYVTWRGAQDLPTRFDGPVTEAQRALSRRTDLDDHLSEKTVEKIIANRPKDPMRFFRWALTLATVTALALTAREGFREKVLWDAALSVKGKLVAFEKGPSKQFFEYLPAPVTHFLPKWVLAGKLSGEHPQTDLYVIEYTGPNGQPHEARLEGAEFYVAPAQVGDEADLTYLEGNPPRIKGPARARDAAFIEHVPWAIAIGALWLLISTALTIIPFFLRQVMPTVRKLVASNSTVITDRPELR